jgi:tyrosine-protein phosphatase SIW14
MRHEIKSRSGLAVLLTAVLFLPGHSGASSNSEQQAEVKSSPVTAQVLPQSSERIYNLSGLSNVGRVAPGIYRGALPEKVGYETLRKIGIKTVIDMRTTGSEKSEVEAASMRSIAIPIQMSRTGLLPKVEQVVELMADPANQPVYVHCRHGQDRTGIVVAAYRMKYQGWSLADAETDMQAYGFNDIWVNFKKFIRQYGKEIDQKKSMVRSSK